MIIVILIEKIKKIAFFSKLFQPLKPGKDICAKFQKHEDNGIPFSKIQHNTVLHPKQITKHTIVQNTQFYFFIVMKQNRRKT